MFSWHLLKILVSWQLAGWEGKEVTASEENRKSIRWNGAGCFSSSLSWPFLSSSPLFSHLPSLLFTHPSLPLSLLLCVASNMCVLLSGSCCGPCPELFVWVFAVKGTVVGPLSLSLCASQAPHWEGPGKGATAPAVNGTGTMSWPVPAWVCIWAWHYRTTITPTRPCNRVQVTSLLQSKDGAAQELIH